MSELRPTMPKKQRLLAALRKAGKLLLIAIDEAHCISQWGPSFRKSYLDLHLLRQCVPGVPFLALTATATPHVRDDNVANQVRVGFLPRQPHRRAAEGAAQPRRHTVLYSCTHTLAQPRLPALA